MAKAKMFKVTGRSGFPLDMLRYDGCYPRNSESVAAIHTSLDRTERAPEGGWVVELTAPGGSITSGRWASFGWRVTQ